MTISWDNWILVVDADPASRQQIQVCERDKPPLRAVKCDEASNANLDICKEVERFPAFCDVSRSACVYGVLDSAVTIESTLRAHESSHRKSPSDSTPPP